MGHMRTVRHLAAWLIMLGTPAAQGAEPVSASNWRRHPDIAEIRAIYREIKQAETAGRLRNLRRDCGPMISAPFISMRAVLFAATTSPAPRMTPAPNMPFTMMRRED